MKIIDKLNLSWSVSRGRDTYGYNICRLDCVRSGRRFRCMGGGYDMMGTVFGEWLEATHQDKLQAIKGRCHTIVDTVMGRGTNPRTDFLYGTTWGEDGRVHLDGAAGIDSMIKVAQACGLVVERNYKTKGRLRSETLGWIVYEREGMDAAELS